MYGLRRVGAGGSRWRFSFDSISTRQLATVR